MLYFFVLQRPNSGPDHLIVEVSRSHTTRHTHTHTHTHTIGVIWKRDRLVPDNAAYTTYKGNTYALDRIITGVGIFPFDRLRTSTILLNICRGRNK